MFRQFYDVNQSMMLVPLYNPHLPSEWRYSLPKSLEYSLLIAHSWVPSLEIVLTLRQLPCPQTCPLPRGNRQLVTDQNGVQRPSLFAHEICGGFYREGITIQPPPCLVLHPSLPKVSVLRALPVNLLHLTLHLRACF